MRLIRSNKDTIGVKVNPLDVEKKSRIIGFPQLESTAATVIHKLNDSASIATTKILEVSKLYLKSREEDP